MKNILVAMFSLLLAGEAVNAQHAGGQDGVEATVSIRQNDFALCGQPFYDDLYALTVEVFADGASSVVSSEYAARVFALVRAAEEFAGNADAFVDHIKDIPDQLLQIIREDPTVLASCASFSVALVGPP